MAEIVPEEQVQKVKSRLLEDLDFEPEQVVNFYTRNIFQRALAHLVGWTGLSSKMLRCTEGGILKTAPTATGLEHNDTKKGNAPDDYAGMITFDQVAARLDIFIFDNPAIIKRSLDGIVYEDEIEVPAGFYSVDVVTVGFDIKNETAASVARYQIIGWW